MVFGGWLACGDRRVIAAAGLEASVSSSDCCLISIVDGNAISESQRIRGGRAYSCPVDWMCSGERLELQHDNNHC